MNCLSLTEAIKSATNENGAVNQSHEHHFHNYRGPMMLVLPDGHVYQKCCKCSETRTIHMEHA